MADELSRFRVIEGGPAEDGKPKRAGGRAPAKGRIEMLLCHVCKVDIGVATATTLEVKTGRMLKDGKPQGGTKRLICVECLSRGKVTHLI
ncbi:hypothetical protein [Frigidibacter sp. MR17.24]|uniref:hypothetical protein n=1 Tax=Frigidibacter sp. MR17.24 TaxID=3127345 RepID=UPI00301315CB